MLCAVCLCSYYAIANSGSKVYISRILATLVLYIPLLDVFGIAFFRLLRHQTGHLPLIATIQSHRPVQRCTRRTVQRARPVRTGAVAEQRGIRSLVRGSLIRIGLVIPIAVRCIPNERQYHQNNGDQCAGHNADDHGRALVRLGADAGRHLWPAALVVVAGRRLLRIISVVLVFLLVFHFIFLHAAAFPLELTLPLEFPVPFALVLGLGSLRFELRRGVGLPVVLRSVAVPTQQKKSINNHAFTRIHTHSHACIQCGQARHLREIFLGVIDAIVNVGGGGRLKVGRFG